MLGCIAAVILVLIGIGAIWALANPEPASLVLTFLQCETAGDYDGMRTFVTKESVSLFPPNENLPPRPKNHFVAWDRKNVTIGEAVVTENTATVPVEGAGPILPWLGTAAAEQPIEIALVKQGWRWKIDLKATIENIRQKRSTDTMPAGEEVQP